MGLNKHKVGSIRARVGLKRHKVGLDSVKTGQECQQTVNNSDFKDFQKISKAFKAFQRPSETFRDLKSLSKPLGAFQRHQVSNTRKELTVCGLEKVKIYLFIRLGIVRP